MKSLWEGFIVPFTRFTLPAVEKAVRSTGPTCVVTDQHALAGALAAERHGIPWATFCTSTIELGDPFRELPKAAAWIRGHWSALSAEAGLADGPGDRPALLPVPGDRLQPARSCSATRILPGHFALVGPALSARPTEQSFPWDRLDPARRHVLVTVGTMADADAMDFYPRAVEALRPLGDSVQAIVLAPPEALPGVPEHIMRDRADPAGRAAAALGRGGLPRRPEHGLRDAEQRDVPLVVAPLTRDQPINAGRTSSGSAPASGLHFYRARPDQLRTAVLALLSDPGYRAAAGRVRDSFAAAGGAPAGRGAP